MKRDNALTWLVALLAIFFLFFGGLGMISGFDRNGVMGACFPFFGIMGIFMFLIGILVIVGLTLGILWLVNQLQKPKGK